MMCRTPNCPRQSKTKIGFCTNCASKYEDKKQEYFEDLYYDKEVNENGRK